MIQFDADKLSKSKLWRNPWFLAAAGAVVVAAIALPRRREPLPYPETPAPPTIPLAEAGTELPYFSGPHPQEVDIERIRAGVDMAGIAADVRIAELQAGMTPERHDQVAAAIRELANRVVIARPPETSTAAPAAQRRYRVVVPSTAATRERIRAEMVRATGFQWYNHGADQLATTATSATLAQIRARSPYRVYATAI